MRTHNDVTVKLSPVLEFSVHDIPDNSDQKKFTFSYQDPNKENEYLMLVTFPQGEKPIETPMEFDKETRTWSATVIKSKDVSEGFLISTAAVVGKEDNDKFPVLAEAFISLKNGVVQPVNKVVDGPPEGKLETFLLDANGKLRPVAIPDEKLLNQHERFITIYTPHGYDAKRIRPYDLQITLDGGQYIRKMHMPEVLDHLVAKKEIEPTVVVFIEPHSGPPDATKKGLEPVVPVGYAYSMRLHEYCCNDKFADKLAALPSALRKHFNVTRDPQNTTIWGISAGGLQATYTALLHPGVFGNVVAQSPMAWNIPIQNGEDWRAGIVDKQTPFVDEKTPQVDITWTTGTAILPEKEGEHREYLTEAVRKGWDELTGRDIKPKSLTFYFDAGIKEKEYDAKEGSANLVKATELLLGALQEQGAKVIDGRVHLLEGGHHNMTWMRNLADASKAIHPSHFLKLQAASAPSESAVVKEASVTREKRPRDVSDEDKDVPMEETDSSKKQKTQDPEPPRSPNNQFK